MKTVPLLSEAAAHAIKREGPTDVQLAEMLNGYKPLDLLSRQIRWMAHRLLEERGYDFSGSKLADSHRQNIPFDPDNLGDV